MKDRALASHAIDQRLVVMQTLEDYLAASGRLQLIRDRPPDFSLATLEEMQRTADLLALHARREARALSRLLSAIKSSKEA